MHAFSHTLICMHYFLKFTSIVYAYVKVKYNEKGYQTMRLENRVAFITGAGRNLGRAIALVFAEEGASIILNDFIEENALSVVAEIKKLGGQAVAVPGDVSDPREVEAMLERGVAHFGKLDILINNAGCTQHVSVTDMSDADWDRILRVNLTSVFYCCRAALKYMIPNNYGKIVNVSSISGKQGGGVWGAAHYSAAKAGVMGFTKTLAREVAQYNITANCVVPGVISINISDQERLAAKAKAAQNVPLGRQGTPEDVAKAYLFLASDDSSYITGEMLDVNGGLYMD